MRAVYDTNIFVSAFAIPGGRAGAAILKAIEGDVHLVISRDIIREVIEVMARKFDRNPEELARMAVYLSELAEVVTPRRRLKVLRDEPDNRILECAVAGKADVVVTGDQAMLRLGSYRRIRILSLKDFLAGAGPA
ncbi:MAG: putative toxin-antitoxin system toxin component, PIN family [Candidatus Muproteobacteria bacterium RIFCSPHIGHO2_01_FULL_65_16]|uniref:Putative toxin-antitoxin system toxin component, PIN family n=1 Tax=Candidatus Muproteobacteria bacterium RIFCSPHIGHO2_01_FULL_65_16 TaxID=1817764 RepID=A0A1F6THM9_9PROT|nr:MAG: putative toxin-antitoxin system toxin component, PIN family [Candidatus Muproteobacteria bacterium RIFCSPHIGHO2_01_FULL_65_16]